MPRVSRKSLNSNYFHVIVQGIEKKYIFEKYKFKEKYKELLINNKNNFNISLLAYCIMDNHAHMLIYSEKISELSAYMKSINTSFAVFYNKSNKRVGYVFRNRFKSEPIKSEAQLYRTLTYIHLNPIVAKMCRYPELYFFSSYNDFINKKKIIGEKELKLLKFDSSNYKDIFKFIHYMHVEGLEYEEQQMKEEKEELIKKYIEENNIIDIIFQSDKVKEMISELKNKKISFSCIAKYLKVSNRKLKQIISD